MMPRSDNIINLHELAISLAKVSHLLVASFPLENLDTDNKNLSQPFIFDYYNNAHESERFHAWISRRSNIKIKKILDYFHQEFSSVLLDENRNIDTDAFYAFKHIISTFKPFNLNGSLRHGDLDNLYEFSEKAKKNHRYQKILIFLQDNTHYLTWPAYCWEIDHPNLRSAERFENFARLVITDITTEIKSILPKKDKVNQFTFFSSPPAKHIISIKKIIKGINGQTDKQKTSLDLFSLLCSQVQQHITELNLSPPPQYLTSTDCARMIFNKINIVLKEAAVRLNILSFMYQPDINCTSEPLFNTDNMPIAYYPSPQTKNPE